MDEQTDGRMGQYKNNAFPDKWWMRKTDDNIITH